jgi:hypothetical protein
LFSDVSDYTFHRILSQDTVIGRNSFDRGTAEPESFSWMGIPADLGVVC